MWSVSTILTGLYSFMIENKPTLGSVETSHRKKRQLAHASLSWNVQNSPIFCKLFPEYVELYKERKQRPETISDSTNESGTPVIPSLHPLQGGDNLHQHGLEMPRRMFGVVAGLIAVFSIILAHRYL